MQFLAELMDNGLLADSFCVTFRQGEYENRSYLIDIWIPCTEPSCNCGIVMFKAKEISEENVEEKEEYNYYLDVLNRKNPSDNIQNVQSIKDINFSKAFVDELNKSNWDELNAFYYAHKVLLSNNLHIFSNIEIDFSPIESEIESTGAMISYYEIFPLVQEISINFQGNNYIINDNYCVSSSCDCQSTLLEFFDENDLETENFTSRYVIYYNYKTGVIEKSPRTKGTPSENNEIISIMLKEVSGIRIIIMNRHITLRKIYANNRVQKSSTENNTEIIKTKRNAPCPCGSGKKYRKCCGS